MYLHKEQDWEEGTTTYWFDHHGAVFGVVDSGVDAPYAVDSKGTPTDGPVAELLIPRVTDEMRG